MVSAQRHLPSALPIPPLYPIPRRLSPQCLRRFGDRRPARRLLCWMLLGVDDVDVRWWHDEPVMDGSYCDARARGENRQRASRVARSRRWSYRRRLVADAAYVRVRSFVDIRPGARAVPWMERLGLAPVFSPGQCPLCPPNRSTNRDIANAKRSGPRRLVLRPLPTVCGELEVMLFRCPRSRSCNSYLPARDRG